MRVLVIEDDDELAETVALGLRRAGMAVDVAFDGLAGMQRALVNDYDVIVLDHDLPGLHGDEICAELVERGCRSRVLMLTAAASTDDLVNGFWLGADDYLPKPFDFPELVARVGALIRRAHPPYRRCFATKTSSWTSLNAGRFGGAGDSISHRRSWACLSS